MRFSIEAVFKAVDRFTRPVAKIQGRMNKFTDLARRGLLKAGAGAVNMAGRLAQITVAATAAAAAVGTIALAADIVKTGADFEQAITDVAAVGLKTRDEIAALEEKAKKLGETTKFTATEAASAMEIMAKAGFEQQDILSGVDGVLSAAAASGLEMAEVANHVSNVLKGMGLEAGEASRVADVLALASSRTNSSIGSLGESMKNVASTARKMNVPMEEAVAAVALLQDVGLDASVAGSAMNTMLTKLAAPTKSMRRQMKELGVSFEDADGNAKSLTDILKNLDIAAAKAGGNMQVTAFFAELVGLRGQKAATNLQDLFASGKVTELTEELEKAQGTAKKMADIRMQTLKGDLTLLGSAVDGVKVSLFDMQGGPLRSIVQRTTEWVSANKDLIKQKFAGFAEGIAKVAELFPKFLEALPTIAKWLKFIAGVGAVLAGVLGVLVAASALFLAVLFAPVTALVAAWAFFPEFFSELWEDVKSIASAFGDFFVGLWEGVKSFFVTTWNFMKGVAVLAWKFIGNNFGAQIEFIKSVLEVVKAVFSAVFEFIGNVVQNQIDKLASFKETLSGVWNTFVEIFNEHVKPILEEFGAWLGKVGTLVDKVAAVGENSNTGGVAVASSSFAPSVQSQGTALQENLQRVAVQSQSELIVELKDPTGSAEVKSKKSSGGKLKVKKTGAD